MVVVEEEGGGRKGREGRGKGVSKVNPAKECLILDLEERS